LLPSATSEPPRLNAGFLTWQLAQTFWVGGLWLLHFVLQPALVKYGLAPLLVDGVHSALSRLLVGFAAFCVLLQALVLVQSLSFAALWRDLRGQLLLAVLSLALLYLGVSQWQPGAQRWLLFNYLLVALGGLLLVLQPPPGLRVAGRR
jgi:uncharacterized membrane protein